jgi:hypothetical protein
MEVQTRFGSGFAEERRLGERSANQTAS